MLTLHGIPELFDLVVCSGQGGIGDKPRLAVLAAERLGAPLAQVVLVDNIEANVEGFRALGGSGYHFKGDEQFVEDVRAERIPGFKPTDVTGTSSMSSRSARSQRPAGTSDRPNGLPPADG
jgi:FMN phosphatase YigB (HAD superfamily)